MTVPDKTVIVVMGVAGSGKTTIAGLLAQDLGWKQTEADDLHGPENVAKMAAGIPLTDSDRAPWLQRISQRIDETEGSQVVTCSALRRRYRDILAEARSTRQITRRAERPRLFAGGRGRIRPSGRTHRRGPLCKPIRAGLEQQQGKRSGNRDGRQVDHQLDGRPHRLARNPISKCHGHIGGGRNGRH